ncbi:hypothetical protein ABGB16_01430 [Micromonospora sp. B11E3]|uniref:hypothetical protein n=1 Tax=Micromonospora sp. B11E3 TaxID=3153562 RepID=UPI00325CF46A
MSVDELRAGLARIAAGVVPDEDPYGRLLRHARRRWRRRFAGYGAAVAALLVAALAGPATLGAAGLPWGPDDRRPGGGYPVDSPWTWRLLDSPPRGSLAGDANLVAELTRVFGAARDEFGMAELPTVRILWIDESAGFRQLVVAYHSDDSAALVTREAPLGTPPGKLVDIGGYANLRPEPFTVLDLGFGSRTVQRTWTLGLAPAGCAVSYARSARVVGPAVQRRWTPAPIGDHMLVEPGFAQGWWRVECDGQTRQEGPIGFSRELHGKGAVPPDLPRDDRPATSALMLDAEMVRPAAESWRGLANLGGLAEPTPVIRWAGRLDGEQAVLLGSPGKGPLVLHVGSGDGGLLALATEEQATPDDTETAATSRAGWPLVATGITPAYDLAAVRVPARSGGHAVLTDRLLVVPARATAVRVEAVADGRVRAAAPVGAGAAELTLPVGAEVTLRALDRNGRVVASGRLVELAEGERLFDERIVSNW